MSGSAVAGLVTLALLTPGPCAAQDTAAPVALRARDLGLYIGHLHVARERADPFSYDATLDTVLGTVGGGYYWTEHVKTEVEFSRSSEGDTSGSIAVDRPDVSGLFRLYTDNETATQLLTVAQSYQFFHNAWFHPFVTGGVDFAWERTRIRIPEQVYYPPPIYGPAGTIPQTRPPIVFPARPDEVDRRFTARAFGGGGFKAYFTERAFFRTDVRTGVGEDRSIVARIGFGVDF